MKSIAWEHWLGLLGVALLVVGSYIGLAVAPREQFMGDVGRILYVHVPTAWIGLVALTIAFGAAVGGLVKPRYRWRNALLYPLIGAGAFLLVWVLIRGATSKEITQQLVLKTGMTTWIVLTLLSVMFMLIVRVVKKSDFTYDDVLVGSVETGVILTAMLLIQGSIWARPTWGVYWTWDPRLTTSAIMLVAFIGVLGLRNFVDDATRRATWSAVATIVAYVDVPIVYFSIKWWRTLHQPFSTPETIASSMKLPLRINAFAILFIAIWLITRRARLAHAKRRTGHEEQSAPAASELIAG